MDLFKSNPFNENKKRKRVILSRSEKNEIWDRQKGKCKCGESLSPSIVEYHHKDGNPSNHSLSNIIALCPICHKKATNRQRIKKVRKNREIQEEDNPFELPELNLPKF